MDEIGVSVPKLDAILGKDLTGFHLEKWHDDGRPRVIYVLIRNGDNTGFVVSDEQATTRRARA